MKKYLIYLILCTSLFIVSCGRTDNSGTKDEIKKQHDALDVVSDNELSRVDEEETVQPENKENNIEGPKPINPNIEIKGDINTANGSRPLSDPLCFVGYKRKKLPASIPMIKNPSSSGQSRPVPRERTSLQNMPTMEQATAFS